MGRWRKELASLNGAWLFREVFRTNNDLPQVLYGIWNYEKNFHEINSTYLVAIDSLDINSVPLGITIVLSVYGRT